MLICWIAANWIQSSAIHTKYVHIRHSNLIIILVPISLLITVREKSGLWMFVMFYP
ncbi:hypothetical protein L873DRAFT_1822843 [Choiromyces venosus 120613-1]|uniref:Uncharacterized protein n=1 Tax=Choiromyces venosus 120613-1 TaxID=1336337 RepID=A0A3N4IT92_9PEZI|nr:hypothetical protein L873DRAFT_1822843 [Choiromyces venosus 120613-1]